MVVNISFLYLDAPLLDENIFIFVIGSCLIDPSLSPISAFCFFLAPVFVLNSIFLTKYCYPSFLFACLFPFA